MDALEANQNVPTLVPKAIDALLECPATPQSARTILRSVRSAPLPEQARSLRMVLDSIPKHEYETYPLQVRHDVAGGMTQATLEGWL